MRVCYINVVHLLFFPDLFDDSMAVPHRAVEQIFHWYNWGFGLSPILLPGTPSALCQLAISGKAMLTGTLDSFLLSTVPEWNRSTRSNAKAQNRRPRDRRRPRQQQQKRQQNRRRCRRNGSNKSKSTPSLHARDLTDPKEIATHKVKKHLKTIGRCQPVSWLSPFADKSARDHEAGSLESFSLPELVFEGNEKIDNVIAKQKENSTNSHKMNTEGVGSNNTEGKDVAVDFDEDRQHLQPTIASNEGSNGLNMIISLTQDSAPKNYVARRSDFFGKCRITAKLSKQRAAHRRGKMGRRTLAAEYASKLTPRSTQILNTYDAGLIPRVGTTAEIAPDGVLSLSSRHFGPMHAKILIQYLEQLCLTSELSKAAHRPLKTIILKNNRLDDATACRIVAALQNIHTLEALDMSNNKLGKLTAMAIGKLLNGGNVHSLILSGSMSQGLSASTLMQHVKVCNIQHLDLSYNEISHNATVGAISDVIATSKVLKTLNLGWNNFGPRGGITICNAVTENKALESLDLSFNNMGETAITILAQAIKDHRFLTDLNVSGNNFGDECSLQLVDCMEKARRATKSVEGCVLNLQHNHMTRCVADRILERKQTVGNATALARHNTPSINIIVYPLLVAGPYQGSIDPVVSAVAGF